VGLWSRLAGFRRGELDDALGNRTVVQGTLMRVTIHLVSAVSMEPFEDLPEDVLQEVEEEMELIAAALT